MTESTPCLTGQSLTNLEPGGAVSAQRAEEQLLDEVLKAVFLHFKRAFHHLLPCGPGLESAPSRARSQSLRGSTPSTANGQEITGIQRSCTSPNGLQQLLAQRERRPRRTLQTSRHGVNDHDHDSCQYMLRLT